MPQKPLSKHATCAYGSYISSFLSQRRFPRPAREVHRKGRPPNRVPTRYTQGHKQARRNVEQLQ